MKRPTVGTIRLLLMRLDVAAMHYHADRRHVGLWYRCSRDLCAAHNTAIDTARPEAGKAGWR